MKTLKISLVSSVLLVAVSLTSAFAAQPHMQAALTQLRAARAELENATADKAGHRQRAIALVDQAIAEAEQGEAAARPARR